MPRQLIIFIFFTLLLLSKGLHANSTHQRDTNSIQDSIQPEKDTIVIPKGIIPSAADYIVTPRSLEEMRQAFISDTFKTPEDTVILNSKLDSAVYFVEQFFLKKHEISNDTLKTHISKLIHYVKSQPIDSSLDYLRQFTSNDSLSIPGKDSLTLSIGDTIYNYLNYLIDTAKVDSINFLITTKKNDTVSLWLTEEKRNDSTRLILYDDLNHPAGFWVTPKSMKSLNIKLDESTLIEKTDFQRRREENLPTIIEVDRLADYNGVEMIFPQWKIGGIANLNFTQGYVKNWIKGGENNLTTLFDVKFDADYKKGKTIWDNDFEYKIGLLQSGEKGLRKNEDVLEINSKFGTNARKNWYYSGLVNFTTQLFKSYDYPNDSVAISGLLSPSYLVFSLGMDYNPNKDFTLLLSPISSKFTMMADTSRFDQNNYGIPKDKKTRKELGIYIKSIYNLQLHEDIRMENKINLFTNYLKNPQNIDIDWEITFRMKITELINTTINTHIIYDHDVIQKLQFKEVLSIGIMFRF